MKQFVLAHMIINVDYVHVKKRRYFVFFHVLNNVNLFNEQFQCNFATFNFAIDYLKNEKHVVNLH